MCHDNSVPMAQSVWKYTTACAVILLLGCLFYLSEYYSVFLETPARIRSFNSHIFHNYFVKSYKFYNGVLEMKGYYSGNNITYNAGVKLEGLGVLLNDLKPELVNDPKLEEAVLPDGKYFTEDRHVKDVNCNLIVNGDEEETKIASNISESEPREGVLGPVDYINLTSNCLSFIYKRGYIMSSLTKVEADFPIAFSLLMYKDVEQAERLFRAIYRPQNIYCIHVDKKTSDNIYKAMEGIAGCFENVFIAPRRINVQWGQFSVLEPELMCMEELLQRNKKWKYFINLTGQEFPLRTNYELVRILMTYNGANDLEGTVRRANKDRWNKLPPPPHNLTATKGSVHIVVNRDFVDFAIHNQKAKDLLEWVKQVSVPDECYFATLNHNPILRIRGSYLGYPETDTTEIKPFLSRFKNWGNGNSNWPCHGKRVRMICNFGAGDLPLLSTRRELFANKFDWVYERFARDCMEELHFNRTRDEYLGKMSFDTRYYKELGFVKNKVE